MKKPNIFNYATSELSQDAIICYILEWAKIENEKLNKNLHSLAINFLDSLFGKFNTIKKPSNYKKIEIKKQYKNIDVLCIVNDEYSIIIEDKTNTNNHSNQLKRYFDIIGQDFSETKILPIYFKTGDQSNYLNVHTNGYQVYKRKDFLNVLTATSYKNDIIEDYTAYLQNIEDSINSYKILPINEWSGNAWKGFYMELREKLEDGNWKKVNNKGGGFLGFWWDQDTQATYRIGLQIEAKKQNKQYVGQIKIKLYSKDDEKVNKSIRNEWKKHILYNEGNIKIVKPKNMGAGKSVTIGVLENEFRITDDKNILNMEETISFIKKIEKIKQDKLATFNK